MNIEEKKIIAEFVGYDVNVGVNDTEKKWFGHPTDPMKNTTADNYNPDTNHTQFGEVQLELSPEQWIEVIKKTMGVHALTYGNIVLFMDRLLHDLPKVMQAVMEVIKGAEGEN